MESALSSSSSSEGASRYRIQFFLAYSSVCLIWGSTYLAVRFALETLPIFTMGAFRFIIAGLVMYGVARLMGEAHPTKEQWKSSGIVGLFLIMGGNAGSMLGVKYIPTGIAALLTTSLPMWMVLLDWLRPRGSRPHGGVIIGLLLGCIGIVWLLQPWNTSLHVSHGQYNYPLGTLAILGGTTAWAFGSMYARYATKPAGAFIGTAAQLLVGGVAMAIFSGLMGEWSSIHLQTISVKSLFALVYLIIFGSIITFASYGWLIRNTIPALASSYTYINPVIALLLGATLGGEPITIMTIIAGMIIISAVLMIAKFRSAPVPTILLRRLHHSKAAKNGVAQPVAVKHKV